MKKLLLTFLLSAILLAGCTPTPNKPSPSSAPVSLSSSAVLESSSTTERVPISEPASNVLSDTAVSPQYLLNVNTTNDIAFLIGMKYDLAKKYWDENNVDIINQDGSILTKFTVVLASGVYIEVGQEDIIHTLIVDYTKTVSRDAVSLAGLNGYETIESIAERFGKENVYPYNQNLEYGGKITDDVSKDMCSVIQYRYTFYRANFDENGAITTAFIGVPI